jgi:hypothetical protein
VVPFGEYNGLHISAEMMMASFYPEGRKGSMIIVDGLLILAMLFFLFLPITDRKTVRMKLCVILAIAAVFAASVTHTMAPKVQVASAAREH